MAPLKMGMVGGGPDALVCERRVLWLRHDLRVSRRSKKLRVLSPTTGNESRLS
jgi:hypothetical protein